ncbi:MAG: holo-ACP synthase [Halolamina sp.]
MVRGIGVDVVSFERTERCLSPSFVARAFTDREVAYAESQGLRIAAYATTFAAKEATFKALGTGWTDGQAVEIRRDRRGQPRAVVRNTGEELRLSLAFETAHAIAIALWR